MNIPAVEPTLGSVSAQLEELRDLFRRRLLDDRDKRVLLQQLSERVERAEQLRESLLLAPLVRQLALIIDRMEATGDGAVTGSFVEELIDVLAVHGVAEVAGSGEVDPGAHEIARVEGNGDSGPMRVHRVLRRGFTIEGQVIRPALVVVTRRSAAEDPESPGVHGAAEPGPSQPTVPGEPW